MTEKDLEVLYIGIHLSASKSRSYRDAVIRRFQTLTQFLQDKNLTTRKLLGENEVPNDEFKIMRSDLTDDGFELFKRGVDKWTKKITNPDDGCPIEDTTILEQELAKIRAL